MDGNQCALEFEAEEIGALRPWIYIQLRKHPNVASLSSSRETGAISIGLQRGGVRGRAAVDPRTSESPDRRDRSFFSVTGGGPQGKSRPQAP